MNPRFQAIDCTFSIGVRCVLNEVDLKALRTEGARQGYSIIGYLEQRAIGVRIARISYHQSHPVGLEECGLVHQVRRVIDPARQLLQSPRLTETYEEKADQNRGSH